VYIDLAHLYWQCERNNEAEAFYGFVREFSLSHLMANSKYLITSSAHISSISSAPPLYQYHLRFTLKRKMIQYNPKLYQLHAGAFLEVLLEDPQEASFAPISIPIEISPYILEKGEFLVESPTFSKIVPATPSSTTPRTPTTPTTPRTPTSTRPATPTKTTATNRVLEVIVYLFSDKTRTKMIGQHHQLCSVLS